MPEAELDLRERYEQRGRRLVFALLGAGALMLSIALIAAMQSIVSIERDTEAVRHTLEVRAAIAEVAAQAERIETARRGFIIQPEADFRPIVATALTRFDTGYLRLRRLVSDNDAQLKRLEEIRPLGNTKRELVTRMFDAPAPVIGGILRAGFNTDPGVAITRRIRTILREMEAHERVLQSRRSDQQASSRFQFYVIGGIALALVTGFMIGAIAIVMRYARELGKAQGKLHGVNQALEISVEERTAELRRANAEIQRFAYIVSHDLRSPLVNVLGFTSELDQARKTLHTYLSKLFEERPELRDQGAWLAVEEDLPEALSFIRTSTQKMDRLINSILELSRQGRRVLRPEVLDMTDLAQGVASTLHQRAEAAGAQVKVSALPTVECDRMAVEQILANLVENALKYLSPDRAGVVEIEGRRHGGKVEISVTDNGRGIAPADHERIFDLFRRAGTQDQPGEGIGLANVRALAYRLGGRVDVESQLGQGARFTLTLPEKFSAPELVE